MFRRTIHLPCFLRTTHIFSNRNKLHLRRNNALPRIVHLRYISIIPCTTHFLIGRAKRNALRILTHSIVSRLITTFGDPLCIIALVNPSLTQARQSPLQIQLHRWVCRRSTRVIHPNGLILLNRIIDSLRVR